MKVIFKVDFGNKSGFGHLERIIALSFEFAEAGHLTYIITTAKIPDKFVVRFHSSSQLLSFEECFNLSKQEISNLKPDEDEVFTGRLCQKIDSNLLVCDSYKIDFQWQRNIKRIVRYLIVIDDYMIERYYADIVISGTFAKHRELFNKRNAMEDAIFLHGEKFTLLGREPTFLEQKEQSSFDFLIFLGFSAPFSLINEVLAFVKECDENFRICVIWGEAFKYCNGAKNRSASEVNLEFTDNFLSLLNSSKYSILGGGLTSLQRVALKRKGIVVCWTENQLKGCKALEAKGEEVVYTDSADYKENFFKSLIVLQEEKLDSCSNLIDWKAPARIRYHIEELVNKNEHR